MTKKTKSLTFRIFESTFLVGVLVYFLCAMLFMSNLYSYFEKQIGKELETETLFLQNYALEQKLDFLQSLDTENRITLISPNGTVYFDNKVPVSSLENHASRTEFLGAKENGKITVSRYSDTMLEKTIYYAVLLKNNDVLRISCNQHSVVVLMLEMSQDLLVMLVIAMIISGFAASFLSRRIVEPLNKINLENPETSPVYEELIPFTKRIAEENYEKAQREELRQQFTANVSHELKTPLTSISGFAEIIKSGDTDKQTTMDFASSIYDESQRMICLVNDIIKLSKLDEKSISQEKEEVDLLEICRQVVSQLRTEAEKQKISLAITTKNQLKKEITVYGVAPVLYEMVYNLVDNGIKYNKQNGFVEVCLENQEDTGCIILTVLDNGIGIPEKEQDRIFERFYTVDKSRSKEKGGTGLGLSIVKHGAKYHGAEINLKSQEGIGSRFTITFNNK